MVKVYGPMMSLDASGTIGDTATFSKWKGRNYVRERVVPSNPKSGPQVGMRAMLSFLSKQWASLTAAEQATWEDRAKAKTVSNFNAFVSYNQTRWRSFKGPSQEDPAAEASGTPSAPTTTPTGGIRQVELSIADGGTAPDWGWMIYRSTTSGFTPAYSNCVAIVPRSGTPTVYIDSGLAADTYYYRIGGFNDDGVKGTLEVERSATVT